MCEEIRQIKEAQEIVDLVNVYGREYPLRYGREELLIQLIASALRRERQAALIEGANQQSGGKT